MCDLGKLYKRPAGKIEAVQNYDYTYFTECHTIYENCKSSYFFKLN